MWITNRDMLSTLFQNPSRIKATLAVSLPLKYSQNKFFPAPKTEALSAGIAKQVKKISLLLEMENFMLIILLLFYA